MIITGEVRNIIYHNEESHYYILAVDLGDKEVTITGTFSNLVVDMNYEFHVTEKAHPIYGKQYVAEAARIIQPSGNKQIQDFLASGLFEGIGDTMAARIVDAFGQDALDIMRYNPRRLLEIQGIGEATFEKIQASFQSHMEAEDTLFFLSQLGLSVKQSLKIYEAYGPNTIDKLKRNPYYLVKDIRGLGFKQVDQLASKLGFDERSMERVESIIIYLLESEAMNGHMFLYHDDLYRMVKEMVGHPEELFETAMTDLTIRGDIFLEVVKEGESAQSQMMDPRDLHPGKRIIEPFEAAHRIDESTDSPKPVIRVYTHQMHLIEVGIIREIARIQYGMTKDISFKGNFSKLELTFEQQLAVDMAFDEPMFILTGGPGTGKTTILRELMLRMEAAEVTFALCAPTGRAASRMEEVIERPASTIHRLLEYQFNEDTNFLHFERNHENPLDAKVLVVDEVSMLDAPLCLKLLEAVRTGSRVIFIGDSNQLPAVGPGNVLADLMASGVIKTCALTQIHRQAQDSLILLNAHAMLHEGEMFVNQKGRDFFFIQVKQQRELLDTLLDVVATRMPKYYGIDPIKDITVLTPVRGGLLGAENLNLSLQARLNPSKADKIFGRFLPGDKIMQNKNNYTLSWTKAGTLEDGDGIFNGEIGTVELQGKQGMVVLFQDQKRVVYTKELADDLVLAYAMTIHKSQGNEFDYVVLPMFAMPEPLRSKNLIYTAITRAKKQVTLVGDQQIFTQLVHLDKPIIRNSSLGERLKRVYSQAK